MKKRYYARRRRTRRKAKTRFFVIIGVLVAALAVGIFFIVKAITDKPGTDQSPSDSVVLDTPDPNAIDMGADDEATPTAEPTDTPSEALSDDLVPHAVEGVTDPATFGFTTNIMDNDVEVESYQRTDAITFGTGDVYTELEGLITFRGNNYRNLASWGTVSVTEEKLEFMRAKDTGAIGKWGGSGWTGQPLVVKWPAELREKMNIYDQFKTKEDFVEVILCSLDGNIYFMDLETGEKTRDFITIGAPTKGTASLDPRGYPIIYVGQGLQADGDDNGSKDMYFRAFSLIDGKKLMEFGAQSKDPFAHRDWQAYDSSALVDADTDTLIVPGENGVIYTCKLNTTYDPDTGAVTMDSDPVKVKYRYNTAHNEGADGGRYGIEGSLVAWRNYIMGIDNAGMLQCIDLNTMSLVYANNLDDDSDVTMVLEEDPGSGTFYLYTGCEYDDDVRDLGETGEVYVRKLNGLTGEVIWEKPFTAISPENELDGGFLASPILGKEGTTLEGLVIFNGTRLYEDGTKKSKLIAFDKETSDIVWEYDLGITGWSPSSPVPVYSETTDENGKAVGYIVHCEYGGNVELFRVDGDGCTSVSKINMSEELGTTESNNFEATPAVYGNMIVVGSRSGHIFFIKIK
jgi:hypothetical protein